jgi:hypothetical protein
MRTHLDSLNLTKHAPPDEHESGCYEYSRTELNRVCGPLRIMCLAGRRYNLAS